MRKMCGPRVGSLVRAGCVLLLLSAALRVYPDMGIVGGLTHETTTTPGASYTGSITILNTGGSSLSARIYQTDYLFHADGSTLYDDPGTDPRSNAAWITVSSPRVTVPGGRTSTVSYSVAVPGSNQLTGTYWSMIMVEGQSEAPAAREGEFRIQTVVRYAIQVVTTIADTGRHELVFQNPRLIRDAGSSVVAADLANTGDVELHPSVWWELYDEAGARLMRKEADAPRLFPATSTRLKLDLGTLAKGSYRALIVADAGGEDLFGVSYSVEVSP